MFYSCGWAGGIDIRTGDKKNPQSGYIHTNGWYPQYPAIFEKEDAGNGSFYIKVNNTSQNTDDKFKGWYLTVLDSNPRDKRDASSLYLSVCDPEHESSKTAFSLEDLPEQGPIEENPQANYDLAHYVSSFATKHDAGNKSNYHTISAEAQKEFEEECLKNNNRMSYKQFAELYDKHNNTEGTWGTGSDWEQKTWASIVDMNVRWCLHKLLGMALVDMARAKLL